jgi:dTDP-4-amino-4,6-dideoxygalactose transaminase
VGKMMGYKEGDFPVSESVSGRLLRLPFYYGLKNHAEKTIEVIFQNFNNRYMK